MEGAGCYPVGARFVFYYVELYLYIIEEAGKEMKQFLYLDTDIVNSINAQDQKGLITQQTVDTENGSIKDFGHVENISAQGNGMGKVWKFIEAEASVSGGVESTHSSKKRFSNRDIIEKIMHDASYDIAYDCIKPSVVEFGDLSMNKQGNYIEIRRVFDFVDFDYLESLFSENGIIEFIKRDQAVKIEAQVEQSKAGLSREQIRRSGINFKKKVQEAIKINNKQYDDIATIIKALRSFIPYDRMLISDDGYLVPLDDQYFRVNPKNLGFKYGGEITCVGMVTNLIGKDTEPINENNYFATIQFLANEVLRILLPTAQQNICIIHPIAVYYGK